MKPIRVLLAEDDPVSRTLAAAHFARQTDFVLCGMASDGFEALELLERERPDILLLDLVMPGMDGLEVLRRLHDQPLERPPKVVVVSKVKREEVVDYCVSLGAAYFCIKPLDMRRLFPVLRVLHGSLLYEKARALLLKMGAPERQLGLEQACRSAAAIARVPGGALLLKEAYYDAISSGKSSYACVEKNIRSVICAIHREGSPDYRRVLGLLAESVRPPSNRAFLQAVAAYIRD